VRAGPKRATPVSVHDQALELLNRILEEELASVVRYTHYSFMVFGYNRIPIVKWLRAQAAESIAHAQEAGELITLLEGYPSLAIGRLLDSHRSDRAAQSMRRPVVGGAAAARGSRARPARKMRESRLPLAAEYMNHR